MQQMAIRNCFWDPNMCVIMLGPVGFLLCITAWRLNREKYQPKKMKHLQILDGISPRQMARFLKQLGSWPSARPICTFQISEDLEITWTWRFPMEITAKEFPETLFMQINVQFLLNHTFHILFVMAMCISWCASNTQLQRFMWSSNILAMDLFHGHLSVHCMS